MGKIGKILKLTEEIIGYPFNDIHETGDYLILQKYLPSPLTRLIYNSVEKEVNLQKLIEIEIVPDSENANCVSYVAIDDHPMEMEELCSFVSICKFISTIHMSSLELFEPVITSHWFLHKLKS